MAHANILKKGDIIGVAASSSPFDKNEFKKGVKVLNELGFEVYFRKDIFDQSRYLAGTDKRRAEELTEMFVSKKIKAVFFARGGYGSQRVIPLLDSGLLSKHPKPVVGFSDLTALLVFLNQRCSIPTFYGPVLTLLGKTENQITRENLYKVLTTKGNLGESPLGETITLKPGKASGRLVGGCLSLINSSFGTNYEINSDDAVLFLEDVGEKIYVLDRMLTQLKNSGKLKKVRGIIFGAIVLPKGEEYDVRSMIADLLWDFNGPVLMNYPAGHTETFITLPLNVDTSIDAPENSNPRIEFGEGMLK